MVQLYCNTCGEHLGEADLKEKTYVQCAHCRVTMTDATELIDMLKTHELESLKKASNPGSIPITEEHRQLIIEVLKKVKRDLAKVKERMLRNSIEDVTDGSYIEGLQAMEAVTEVPGRRYNRR